jgi:hypothetical protein
VACGSFSQDVTDWAAGSYQITFKAAQRSAANNPYIPSPQQQDFNVLVDGSVVGTFKPSGTSYPRGSPRGWGRTDCSARR